MEDEAKPDKQPQQSAALIGAGRIFGLTDDERAMLREFALKLRLQDVRNQVAREALDRVAEELERASSLPSD